MTCTIRLSRHRIGRCARQHPRPAQLARPWPPTCRGRAFFPSHRGAGRLPPIPATGRACSAVAPGHGSRPEDGPVRGWPAAFIGGRP